MNNYPSKPTKYEVAITGVNELLSSIAKDEFTDNTVTIVEFHDYSVDYKLYMSTTLPAKYVGIGANGGTPLNQAVGETCEKVQKDRTLNFSKEDNVLVNIFTDGGENTSVGQYKNSETLASFIKALEADNFTITFQGTQSEVNYAINTLHMNASNMSVHDNTLQSIQRSFASTVSSRVMYSKSVSRGEAVTDNFYTKSVEEEDKKDNK